MEFIEAIDKTENLISGITQLWSYHDNKDILSKVIQEILDRTCAPTTRLRELFFYRGQPREVSELTLETVGLVICTNRDVISQKIVAYKLAKCFRANISGNTHRMSQRKNSMIPDFRKGSGINSKFPKLSYE
jgi:hypothetical protein